MKSKSKLKHQTETNWNTDDVYKYLLGDLLEGSQTSLVLLENANKRIAYLENTIKNNVRSLRLVTEHIERDITFLRI